MTKFGAGIIFYYLFTCTYMHDAIPYQATITLMAAANEIDRNLHAHA